jgi:tetratricopeptide (TPR) repeat protein
MIKKTILLFSSVLFVFILEAQVNTDRVLTVGRNALYFEDYVLSIRYFNQVIRSKPWIAEPYFYRAVAKLSLDDFQGAEEDCSLCIARNPFYTQAYYVRGIARQSMEMYEEAVRDYKRGLELRPNDRPMMVNLAIAYLQNKNYDEAEAAFGELINTYPKLSLGYLTRGVLYLEKGDTTLALTDLNKAVEIDPYYAPCYGNRAILLYQTGHLKEALADLNEAIRLNTRESGYYINRGLVRYEMNDLRGAMADYDQVIAMDNHNLIARFNRGLLRFQVGNYNHAIEDFDVIIEHEPDNYMAYYNRALLNMEVGEFANAIHDFNIVLEQYPNFISGYFSRAEAKRKLNDAAGADKDYWTAIGLEENNSRNEIIASNKGSEQDRTEEEKTRRQSNKNIDKFNRLVIYDKEEEQKRKYNSEIRGRVQDRNVRIDLEPSFVLTYYEKGDRFGEKTYYDKSTESFNARKKLMWKLLITNQEAALTEEHIAVHFASINDYSAKIEREPDNADYYFGRAIDFMLVQDFTEAIRNFDRVIELNPSYTQAYFNRAVVRYKQMEYNRSQSASTYEDLNSMSLQLGKNQPLPSPVPAKETRKMQDDEYGHEQIIMDYNVVILQNPEFIYAYYNRGNMRCAQRDFRAAIVDYNEAILRDPEFAEAYFNRGLARLSMGDANRGIADLSKAGELGILNAYSIIKRMTAN